jgi:hypothetical protein
MFVGLSIIPQLVLVKNDTKLTPFLNKCSEGGNAGPWPDHDNRNPPISGQPEVRVLADENRQGPPNSHSVLQIRGTHPRTRLV